ncbi:MAG TPA: serine/threonine-protein kinase [Vicinamibacteria bacterium]|nr:serine/threonine-protein kinase [Vicinamibacteria bacterium]
MSTDKDPNKTKPGARLGQKERDELLTADDLFGDIVDQPAERPRDGDSAARRESPIRVQVSEPGAARAQDDELPADMAALLEGFGESKPDPDTDAAVELPPPTSRTGTKFRAMAPRAAAPEGGLDLAGLADEAMSEGTPASLGGPGTVVYGPYRLLERIAVGGMAEVFKAVRAGVEGFQKVVAVKRILPHLSDNKEFVAMFVNEAKMVAGLTHPNIVQIYDLGKIEKCYYIAMEYVHGRDLRTIARRARDRGTAVPLEIAVLVVSRVAAALDYAHRKKDDAGLPMRIVHRDVSPQNILVSFEGEVKLTDFGIAKAASKARANESGALRGKLFYMSPEQAWGRPLDRRSDLYSLGLVLYETVTHQRPFQGTGEGNVLDVVRLGEIPPARSVNPRVPETIERVLAKTLAREPAERYQNGAELQRDLERYLRERSPVSASALVRFLESLFDAGERGDPLAGR